MLNVNEFESRTPYVCFALWYMEHIGKNNGCVLFLPIHLGIFLKYICSRFSFIYTFFEPLILHCWKFISTWRLISYNDFNAEGLLTSSGLLMYQHKIHCSKHNMYKIWRKWKIFSTLLIMDMWIFSYGIFIKVWETR